MARPRILAVWELGANLGHVAKISKVLAWLKDDADLFVALREPWSFRKFDLGLACTILPAPYAPSRKLRAGEEPAANYAGILLTEGWGHREKLSGLVHAWRGLIATVRPDVLLVQSAPTALLAARDLGVKTVVLGGGYDNPPLAQPMPLFVSDSDPERHQLRAIAERQEAEALAMANSVLEELGTGSAERFCDLLRPDLSILACWPCNDHYANRAALDPDHAPYIGPITINGSGAKYHWQKDSGAKIFVYLRSSTKQTVAGLRALAVLAERHDVICAAPGLTKRSRERLIADGLRVEDGPICLDPLLKECDLGISNSSSGISATFVAHGIKQIGLPNHREQAMNARTLASHGLSVGIEGEFGPEAVFQCAEALLTDRAADKRVKMAAVRISKTFAADPSQVAASMIRNLLG